MSEINIWEIAMKKPILFGTEMVKAILEGRKTQTRRIIKPQPVQPVPLGWVCYSTKKNEEGKFEWGKDIYGGITETVEPPYKTGDILYVRETWSIHSMSNYEGKVKFMYKARGDNGLEIRYVKDKRYDELLQWSFKKPWQPSIFMPKEAARLFLKVKDIKVQRLNDISPREAFNEGVSNIILESEHPLRNKAYERGEYDKKTGDLYAGTIEAFAALWDSIYDKQGFGWDTNPWVWVIEFERLENTTCYIGIDAAGKENRVKYRDKES